MQQEIGQGLGKGLGDEMRKGFAQIYDVIQQHNSKKDETLPPKSEIKENPPNDVIDPIRPEPSKPSYLWAIILIGISALVIIATLIHFNNNKDDSSTSDSNQTDKTPGTTKTHDTIFIKPPTYVSNTNSPENRLKSFPIKKVITKQPEEDKNKPLPDDQLAEMLKDKGYPIARRTISKYREQLEIPVARLRRKM